MVQILQVEGENDLRKGGAVLGGAWGTSDNMAAVDATMQEKSGRAADRVEEEMSV